MASLSLPPKSRPKYPEKSLNGKYDYDLIVFGGGSGGLAASKEAVKCRENLKVAVFDFVKPSPAGTQWGLGGTCVNVGCIPKKLMHWTSLLGAQLSDTKSMGWQLTDAEHFNHDWETMVHSVDDYIKGLNYNYKKSLLENRVEYINAYAQFTDPHTMTYNEKGVTKRVTAERFIIACGGRPVYPVETEGWQFGISSDDIFWMTRRPGKTLVVGASYIALECAGFLHHLGFDVSVLVRSILLRGFDQQSASQVGEYMEREGVRFLNNRVISKLHRKNLDGPITVAFIQSLNDGKTPQTVTEEFDTVLWAIGREILVDDIGLQHTGVKIEKRKIVVDAAERTSVPHIYAIGDAILGRPELTPVAIQAGQLLAKRLYGNSKTLMDYNNIPTAVFTPLEYGAVGYSSEAAQAKFGTENVVSYVSRFGVLEGAPIYHATLPQQRSSLFTRRSLWARQHALAHNQPFEDYEEGSFEEEEFVRKHLKQPCLAKLVCVKQQGRELVVGFHYVGPNAGEITQGFALPLKLGATKQDFDMLVGVHPTAAEEFTTLSVTLESGQDFMKKGGC